MTKLAFSLVLMAVLTTARLDARELRTADAVIAADEAWGAAESRGDVGYVDDLLLPSYRSIGSDGKVTPKAAIVAHTKEHGRDPEYASKAAEWRRQHPAGGHVVIEGDIALLTWEPTDGRDGVRSCDVFAYRRGRWHALYSQHTTLS